jgi:hypothetical protein
MIISASYKTDIPAFYGKWFLNRLDAGFCRMINPYNKKAYLISLKKEDVDGFVFWTKNLHPFFHKLNIVHERGFPMMVQYTIHDYPKALEATVLASTKSIDLMKNIAKKYGPRVAVWRYDPIIFTSITSADYHLKNFKRLAGQLEGSTDEVVVSFAQIYRKTRANLNKAAKDLGFTWEDPDDITKIELASSLAEMARDHGMQLTMCSQRAYSQAKGVKEARCVDAQRLSDIAGYRIHAKLKGNRKECGCFESKDIGDYDTCPHGCIYCYAVLDRKLAQKRHLEHDPCSEFLYSPELSKSILTNENCSQEPTYQAKLF